jgi:hypothetical protein
MRNEKNPIKVLKKGIGWLFILSLTITIILVAIVLTKV